MTTISKDGKYSTKLETHGGGWHGEAQLDPSVMSEMWTL
jgi:hypothetical protein